MVPLGKPSETWRAVGSDRKDRAAGLSLRNDIRLYDLGVRKATGSNIQFLEFGVGKGGVRGVCHSMVGFGPSNK